MKTFLKFHSTEEAIKVYIIRADVTLVSISSTTENYDVCIVLEGEKILYWDTCSENHWINISGVDLFQILSSAVLRLSTSSFKFHLWSMQVSFYLV